MIISTIESILRDDVFPSVITVLESVLGIQFEIYRTRSDDIYEKTYGRSSGGSEVHVGNVIGLLATEEEFIPPGQLRTTPLETAHLYTSNINRIKVNDILVYNRGDGTKRKWKVVSREGIGYTTVVIERFKLSQVI